ncbi:hypothetical protein LINPERPRIM_LOCUS28886 [Linum perenne]
MTKFEGDGRLDGLEIVTVGTLYSGPFDKKYWSSSRGRDRYPYPVGFQALRTYNGTIYKLQINEGPKGPLFVIISPDGDSCSAQTPDITMDKFQKKGCQQMKIWEGKRFPCKIDGLEFFGFKDPLVLRWLRWLRQSMENVNEISGGEHQDACKGTDVAPALVRPLVTGKRSKRTKRKTVTSVRSSELKRPCRRDTACTTEVVSNPFNENWKQQGSLDTSTVGFIDEHEPENSKCIPAIQPIMSEAENCQSSAENILPLNSLDDSNDKNGDVVSAIEEATLSGSKNHTCVAADGLHIKGTILDRSPENITESLDIPTSANGKDRNECYENQTLVLPGNFLCAPDTLDPMEELVWRSNLAEPAPNDQGNNMCFDKEELPASTSISERVVSESDNEELPADTSISERVVSESDNEELPADTYLSERVVSESDNEELPADTSISERVVYESDNEELPADTSISERVVSESENEELPADTSISERVVSESDNEELPADTFISERVVSESDNEELPADTSISERVVSESIRGDEMTTRMICTSITKEELIVNDTFMSEEVLSEPHMEDEMVARSSSASSEKFDSDSAGQDTENSMMTLLLPQAIPLLKENSNKKRKYNATTKNFVSWTKPQEENIERLGGQSSKIEQTKVAVADSFESEQCELGQLDLLSDNAKVEESGDGKDERIPHSSDDPLNLDATKSDMEISVPSSRCITTVGKATETEKAISPGHRKVYTRRKKAPKPVKHSAQLSESIICRNYEEGCDPPSMLDSEPLNVSPSIDDGHQKDLSKDRISTGGQLHSPGVEKINTSCKPQLNDLPIRMSTDGESTSNELLTCVPVSEETQFNCKDRLVEHNVLADVDGSLTSHSKEMGMETSGGEVQANADLMLHGSFVGIAEIVGCYIHPLPVLNLWLSSQENEIYICSLCGIHQDKYRTLFLYKLATKAPTTGCPSFVGHTTVSWPSPVYMFGKVAPERSSFQLSPDGQLLVLHGSTKVPCCREGRVDCLCSTCEADSCSSTSVKIVRVNLGYVSVLLELRTDEEIECILVCKPNHLVAAVESGRLHLWTMDSTWSTSKDEFTISNTGNYSPRIVELKSIPKSASLVVGHDGFEEFTLWDISKRTFVSRFSAPGTSIHAFNPISWFSCQRNGHCLSSYNSDEMMEATKLSFTDHHNNSHTSPHMEGEDIAIWLLVSTADPVGSWRLALMAKNTMIIGTTLNPGAVAVGATVGRGVIATGDGVVSMWDLLTGNKLGSLHHFKDGSVSCIATDDSSSSSCFAVGSQTGQLLVYRHL